MKLEGGGQAERANAAQRTEALQRAQEHIDGAFQRFARARLSFKKKTDESGVRRKPRRVLLHFEKSLFHAGLEERLFDLEGKVGGRGVAGTTTQIQLGRSFDSKLQLATRFWPHTWY